MKCINRWIISRFVIIMKPGDIYKVPWRVIPPQRILNSVYHTLDLGPNTLPGAQQYTTVESAAALSIQEKFKGKYDDNICNANGQYRNEWYKRAENMVPQLDGTYNVSDDSDLDLHSYLDLASSNIIAHRTRGQKQRYETDIRAHTSKCLALKESTKPNVNINMKGQRYQMMRILI